MTEDYTHIPASPLVIVGIDPGKATGVAVYDTRTKAFAQQWAADTDTFVDWIHGFLAVWPEPDQILLACERFDITPGTGKLGRGAVNWSIELAGVCRHLARQHQQGFVLQDRATPKHMAPNAMLRKVGWYVKGPDHVNDATRHVVLALARQYKIAPPWVS